MTFLEPRTTSAEPYVKECTDRSESLPTPPTALAQLVGRGEVFIVADGTDETGRVTCWHGRWEAEARTRPVERSGHFDSPEAAIAWGRARTPTVFVRLRHEWGSDRWAGATEPPPGLPVFLPGDR